MIIIICMIIILFILQIIFGITCGLINDVKPFIVIVLVELVPLAITPSPVKFIIVAYVAKLEPSSCIVNDEPHLLHLQNYYQHTLL